MLDEHRQWRERVERALEELRETSTVVASALQQAARESGSQRDHGGIGQRRDQ